MSKVDFSINGDDKGSLLGAAGYFGLALAGSVVAVIGGALGMRGLLDYVKVNGLLDVTIDHTMIEEPEDNEEDISAIDVDYVISDADEEPMESGDIYEHA